MPRNNIRVIYQEGSPYGRPHYVRKTPLRSWLLAIAFFCTVFVVFGVGIFVYSMFRIKNSVIVAREPSSAFALVPITSDPKSILSPTQSNVTFTERVTILFIGIDRQDGQTAEYSRADSLIVVSLDPREKSALLISIPRDLQVEYPPGSSQYIKINAIHNHPTLGEERGSGPRALKSMISSILGIPIHYFVRIDFKGFEKVVDEVGGIVVDVPERLVDHLYPDGRDGWMTIDIQQGRQIMNGKTALYYARSRHSENPFYGSDKSRADRQRQILIALKEKVLEQGFLNGISKIQALLGILSESLLTDIQLGEMVNVAELARSIDTTKKTGVVSRYMEEGRLIEHRPGLDWRYYPLDPTWKATHAWVKELFEHPELKEDLSNENATIQVLNATEAEGLAQELTDILKQQYSLRILEPGNASETLSSSLVVDHSNGKYPVTVDFLRSYVHGVVKIPDRIYPEQRAEIVVIVGKEYVRLSEERKNGNMVKATVRP